MQLIFIAPLLDAELNWVEHKSVIFHDAHPMEWEAIVGDAGKDPWQ
jgi:hypothetical protein